MKYCLIELDQQATRQKEKIMNKAAHTKWYKFYQNFSESFLDYSENKGISYIVYIEAENAEKANVRAVMIGMDFSYDSEGYCDWERVEDDIPSDFVESNKVPEKDALLVQDDNKPYSSVVSKMMVKGKYDVFVHPLEGDFYGAYKTVKHIKRKVTGYGLGFSEASCGEIFGVGEDGWDRAGNSRVPAPGARGTEFPLIEDTPDFRVSSSRLLVGHYTAWAREKSTLEAIVEYYKNREFRSVMDDIRELKK